MALDIFKAFDRVLHAGILRKLRSYGISGQIFDSYIISIAKTASKKNGALIRSMKFFSAEVALYIYNSTV